MVNTTRSASLRRVSTSFITARCSFGSIRNAVRASRGNPAGSFACIAFWMLAIGRTSSTAPSPIDEAAALLERELALHACATIASMLARRIDAQPSCRTFSSRELTLTRAFGGSGSTG